MLGRRALTVTLLGLAATALLFTLWSRLDVRVSGLIEDQDPSFALRLSPLAVALRGVGMLVPNLVIGALVGAVLWRVARPGRPLFADARAIVAVLLTFALAPGLLVNGVLKEHSNRPRPAITLQSVEHGRPDPFRAWWDWSGSCRSNCSFASGEVSSAMVLVAAATLLPAGLSEGGAVLALGFTLAVAGLRLAFGGHYLSDVLFAALLTHLVAFASFRLMHSPRWAYGRLGGLERALDGLGRLLRGGPQPL